MVSWTELTGWWLREVSDDPAYEHVVTPLLLDVLRPEPQGRYVDLGCGEGRVMRMLSEIVNVVVGIDINPELVRRAPTSVAADILNMPFRSDAFSGAYSVLTLEHLEDHVSFFHESARVVEPGGILAIVINHPIWTAPDSTPISDSDGEVLWRPGRYFSNDSSSIPAGESEVTFHHRSIADLMNAAATAGWSLERMIERPHHELVDQHGIPRLLACRWRLVGEKEHRRPLTSGVPILESHNELASLQGRNNDV